MWTGHRENEGDLWNCKKGERVRAGILAFSSFILRRGVMTAPSLTALLPSVCNPTELLSILRVCPMVPMPVPWLRVFSLPGTCFLSTRHTRRTHLARISSGITSSRKPHSRTHMSFLPSPQLSSCSLRWLFPPSTLGYSFLPVSPSPN